MRLKAGTRIIGSVVEVYLAKFECGEDKYFASYQDAQEAGAVTIRDVLAVIEGTSYFLIEEDSIRVMPKNYAKSRDEAISKLTMDEQIALGVAE
mgnify:CR=1 FL=1